MKICLMVWRNHIYYVHIATSDDQLILAVNAIEAVREHLPSLLMRTNALVRHGDHIYRTLVRLIEAALLWFQSSPRISHRRTVGQSSMEASSDEKAARKASAPISGEGGSTSERSAFENSPACARRRERLEGKKLIISVHIPKTGGTAFADILRQIAQGVFYLDYGPQPFSPTALYQRGQLAAGWRDASWQFESFTEEELLGGRSVIHGHFVISKYLKKFPEASYITWLRDPVERIASSYFFWQRAALEHSLIDDSLCNKVISEKMSLVEFAELKETRNSQYCYLAPAGVEYCAFIGITEEYDRSVKLFQKLFCPELEIAPQLKNQNPDRATGFYNLEMGVREKIREVNDLDVKTYQEGLHRFHTLCDEVGI